LVIERDDGETISIGLDGQMDSPDRGKQIFTGTSPHHADSKWLLIGESGKSEVISLLLK